MDFARTSATSTPSGLLLSFLIKKEIPKDVLNPEVLDKIQVEFK